jgi:hypothetical protein
MPFMKSNTGEGAAIIRPPNTRHWLLRVSWLIARPVIIAYLLVLLIMTFLETWLVYPIPPNEHRNWKQAGQQYDEVWFAAEDGTKIYGWFASHPDSHRAVLYCHGNGEDVSDNSILLEDFRRELHASVFIFTIAAMDAVKATQRSPVASPTGWRRNAGWPIAWD